MSTQLETNHPVSGVRSEKATKSKKATYVFFVLSWLVLIAGGVIGTKLYTDTLKQQLFTELAAQTEIQLAAMQANYQQQVDQLQTSLTGDMTALQAKVDSFNELLAFTKDSANSKTDNSNQLYTQLQEVKSKLDELQKNLDVLK